MPSSKKWTAAGLVLAAALLEIASWPGGQAGLWLGPAFLIGLGPVLGCPLLPYCLAGLLSTLACLLFQPLALGLVIPLHFGLTYLAWRQKNVRWLLAAVLIGPPLWLAIAQPTWSAIPWVMASVALQYLLAIWLQNRLQAAVQALNLQAKRRQAAHGVALAGSVATQLDQFGSVASALAGNTDRLYAIYQELELLSRSDPQLATDLPSRVLETAQDNHQTKLLLQTQTASLEENLRFLAGRRGATLGEICSWVAARLEQSAEQLGKQVTCQVDSGEDHPVELFQQLNLAYLLQALCQQEQRALNAPHSWISFAGYQTSGKLRVVVTLQAAPFGTGGEWPNLRPLPCAKWLASGQRAAVVCKKGVTAAGQVVLTVEMG